MPGLHASPSRSSLHEAKNDTGRVAFCGPVVLSAITGYSVSKVETEIRTFRNIDPDRKPVVRGTYTEEVAAALDHFGYIMELKESFMHLSRKERPSLSSWVDSRRAGKERRKIFSYYVLAIHKKNEGHWVLIKGSHLCDTYTEGRGSSCAKAPTRVRGSWKCSRCARRWKSDCSLSPRSCAARGRERESPPQLFNFGSSQSRKLSPNRLNANTASVMATPGNRIIHGAVW